MLIVYLLGTIGFYISENMVRFREVWLRRKLKWRIIWNGWSINQQFKTEVILGTELWLANTNHVVSFYKRQSCKFFKVIFWTKWFYDYINCLRVLKLLGLFRGIATWVSSPYDGWAFTLAHQTYQHTPFQSRETP